MKVACYVDPSMEPDLSNVPNKLSAAITKFKQLTETPSFDCHHENLVFQQFLIDYYLAACEKHDHYLTPVIRIFGRTGLGSSVTCHVHGYLPHFYVAVPGGFQTNHCQILKAFLNAKFLNYSKGIFEVVSRIELQLGLTEEDMKTRTIKLTIVNPSMVTEIQNAMWEANGKVVGLEGMMMSASRTCGEYVETFLTGMKMTAFSWIEIKAGKCVRRSSSDSSNKKETAVTTSDIEVDVQQQDVCMHDSACATIKMAPLLTMAFDIECATRPKIGGRKDEQLFPVAREDQVIQISTILHRNGEEEPLMSTIFTLRSCDEPDNVLSLSYSNEKLMLEAWACFLEKCNPDILLSFNGISFDIDYILDRAHVLGSTIYPNIGRVKGERTQVWVMTKEERQLKSSRIQNKTVNISGIIFFDLMIFLQKRYGMIKYSLQECTFQFLLDRKIEMKPRQMINLFNGSSYDRKVLANYCILDSLYLIRIMREQNILNKCIDDARKSRIQLDKWLEYGHVQEKPDIHKLKLFHPGSDSSSGEGFKSAEANKNVFNTPFKAPRCLQTLNAKSIKESKVIIAEEVMDKTLQPTVSPIRKRLGMSRTTVQRPTKSGDKL